MLRHTALGAALPAPLGPGRRGRAETSHPRDPAAPSHETALPGDTDLPDALPAGQSACCCAHQPAFSAVLAAPAPGAALVELLLCADHFRASRGALRAAGAVVFDVGGRLVLPRPQARGGLQHEPLPECHSGRSGPDPGL